MTKTFWQSKSDRAIVVFLCLALPFLLVVTLDVSPRPAFVVTEAGEPKDGRAELRWNRVLKPGLRVREYGIVKTRTASVTLRHEGTLVTVNARSNMEVRSITPDRIELLATRGHWSIRPDREVTTCTRAVCTTSSSPIETFYYTPGEVVRIIAGGPTTVTFRNQIVDLASGDRLTLDELTGATDLVHTTP